MQPHPALTAFNDRAEAYSASIVEAFRAARRPALSPDMRERLAGYLAGWKDQETALLSRPDPATQRELHGAMLAYLDARKEADRPDLIAARLDEEAAALERNAEHSLRSVEDCRRKLSWPAFEGAHEQRRLERAIFNLTSSAEADRMAADDLRDQAIMVRLEGYIAEACAPLAVVLPIRATVRLPDASLFEAA